LNGVEGDRHSNEEKSSIPVLDTRFSAITVLEEDNSKNGSNYGH
jgi:hypothetical protein